MSVTFSVAVEVDGGLRPAYRCNCAMRWCDACDQADTDGQEWPEQFTCENCTDKDINMASINAADWMRWVGLTSAPGGEIKASELAALCRRRLWNEARNHDQPVTSEDFAKRFGLEGYPRVIFGERDGDYLRNRTIQMLKLCELAGDGWITWG